MTCIPEIMTTIKLQIHFLTNSLFAVDFSDHFITAQLFYDSEHSKDQIILSCGFITLLRLQYKRV
jgi:hypothetical protein